MTLAAPEDTILNKILGMTPELRRAVMLPLEPEERDHIAQLIQERIENPFFRFRGDHRGFVKDGLGEGTSSIQDQIL